jgi:hypothetical protein
MLSHCLGRDRQETRDCVGAYCRGAGRPLEGVRARTARGRGSTGLGALAHCPAREGGGRAWDQHHVAMPWHAGRSQEERVRLLTERTQIHGMASRSPPTIERLRTAAPIERLRTWPSRSLSQFAYQCVAADGKLVWHI